MAKVSTNISLDADLKRSAQELLKDLGMDLTTAVTIFLRQAVREQAMPFAIKRNTPNTQTIAAIEGRRLLDDPNARGYRSIDELKEALRV